MGQPPRWENLYDVDLSYTHAMPKEQGSMYGCLDERKISKGFHIFVNKCVDKEVCSWEYDLLWNMEYRRTRLDCSGFKSWYIKKVRSRYRVGFKECKKDIMV
jgi:hypothetical protein